jgi:AraC-like DNA-binding protein
VAWSRINTYYRRGLEEQDTVQNYLYILLITINTIRQTLDEPWCPAEITITGHPDIATAAEIIGLNKRALQRRLAECGTSYSAAVAEARIAIAIRWIREGKNSLTEIAGSLGYSDPANFSRAYQNRYKVAASP